jgi:hypothetical protein
MRMRTLAAVVLLCGVIGTVPGCGGSSSGTDATDVATPAPPPPPAAEEPPHNPAPPPPACQECEPPVTNTNPPVRLTIRIYKIQDLNGTLLEGPIPPSIPLGYTVTIDATPKDVDNRDTLGSGTVEFTVSDPDLVKIKSNHGFQKKLTILGEGLIEVKASLDGIDSNTLVITLG